MQRALMLCAVSFVANRTYFATVWFVLPKWSSNVKLRRTLPLREQVFIASLRYHGFREGDRRKNLKFRQGYLIRATKHEDASGIDLWVKMPRDERLSPIQITQRGIRLFRTYRNPTEYELARFMHQANARIRTKQKRCFHHGIAFVLVRDFDGKTTNPTIAWGDIKALRYAIAHLRRHLS